ncbi:MAG TPA: hypothetical protein VMF12_01035 [Xanthobacteraceae bacterium]|nr:hypothetical protein [Xanthobacteraceae bacterium]
MLAAFALAFSFLSVQTLLSAAPVAPAIRGATPPVMVNHFRKGDRLPLYRPAAAPPASRMPGDLWTQKKVPLGCDRAFSPVSSPSAANVYGRCLA